MTGLKRKAKRLAKRVAPLGVVLAYHRVALPTADPQLLAVSPENFAEQLRVMGENYRPASLGELCRLTRRPLQATPVVSITFDDGYADNLLQAYPLLREAGIPATVFVVAGKVGKPEDFWWDELGRLLMGPQDLPTELSVTIESATHRWLVPVTAKDHDRSWSVLCDGECTPRQSAYKELCRLLTPLLKERRDEILEQLRQWAGVERKPNASCRVMTEDEVAELAEDGLVEIGSHTMTHTALSALPISSQMREVVDSRTKLESLTHRPVTTFSYPFGEPVHYTPETVDLVRQAGYECACSNFLGTVHWRTPRYEIPRMLVRNWSGDEFDRHLSGLFHA